ncbi:MAG: hypothetical protein ACOC7Y_01915 [Chloroflexota bacterium]
MLSEQVGVTLTVTEALEALGVPYAIGGSFASAAHGVMRATMDADLVADLRPEHAEPLVRALGDRFYADLEAIRDAIRRRASFNLIHLDTAFKIDIFIAGRRPFDRAQLSRRHRHLLSWEPERYAYVTSPEDTILAKLEWYRMGGGVSDRQWRDVLGVLRVQSGRLDLHYLRRMAATLNVTDLLERALNEAASP